jgi:predicted 3-demethylubiquinone-9 3-methyltransferase (glyoxalase superfamily)
MPRITPFLWFDGQAEEAANLYVSIFPGSRIVNVSRRGDAATAPAMSVVFELDGQRIIALNGGPQFHFTEATSFLVDCSTQEEVDRYWSRLGEGGEPGRCGWLKDRFGLSWQVVPGVLGRLLGDPDPRRAGRVMQAMLGMTKLVIADLERAQREDAP